MNAPTDDDRIRQHADLVYRTCLRITGNAQDAADVAQEVFVAWLRQHRDIRGSVAAWLYGTARQRALDWLRANHRRDRHEQQATTLVSAETPDGDWQIHLDAALHELPTPVRMLVVEHHLQGLTQGQLAERHRCTQATISRRLTHALVLLREALRSRGITATGAVLVAGFTTARATACPAPLVAPVLAQAQLVGVPTLVGPFVVGRVALKAWVAIAAAVLGGLIVLLGGAMWWWSAGVARDLDRDWTAVATAHLPPVPASAQPLAVPERSPRYPSIEALIARQRPLDAARQARLEQLIAPAGKAPWSWVDDASMTALANLIPKLRSGEDLTPDEMAVVRKWQAWLQPILEELRHGEAALGSGATLASAYADGRLGSMEQRGAWLRSRGGGDYAMSRRVESLLIHAAAQASDPRSELADLDRWISACSRASTTLMEGLIAQALWESRDRLYQELAWRGRLPPEVQQRWLAEPCPIAPLTSDVLLGEALLMLIPYLDDLRAGRTVDQGAPAYFAYLSLGPAIAWMPQRMEIFQQVLAGQGAERFRALGAEAQRGPRNTYWSIVKNQTDLVALCETRHRAHRLAVEILTRVRQGETVPESWATTEGRGANVWGLRYERQSATRFALVFDPDDGLPACALPDAVETIRSQIQQARAKSRSKPLLDQHLLIEMEVTVPTTPVRFDLPEPSFPAVDDQAPPLPSVAQ